MRGMVTFKWLVLCSLGDRERQQNRLHVQIAMEPAGCVQNKETTNDDFVPETLLLSCHSE